MSISDFPPHNMSVRTIVKNANGGVVSDVTKNVTCSFLCITSLGYVPHFHPLNKGGNQITQDIFNSQVKPYYTNMTYNDITSFLEGNSANTSGAFYPYNWTVFSGYYGEIYIEGESPVVILSNDTQLWRVFECNAPLFESNPTNIPPSSGNPTVAFAVAMALTGKEKTVLYHDIYIEGNEKTNNIYIHTHHNIKDAQITTNWYNSIGDPTGGVYDPSGKDGTYERLGNPQSEEGMLQSYTIEQLHSFGVQNTRAGAWRKLVLKSVAFKFEDNIVDVSDPTGINHYTNYALINTNKTHSIVANTSGEEISDLVVIRFFEGAPSEEVTKKIDGGEDSDGTNYDGTPKDPRTKDDYDDDGELTQGSDEGSSGIFNDIYKVSNLNMRSLHNKIWSQDYFNVLKINSDPIENIISCKRFPFSANAGTEKAIVIGNIDTGVNGAPVEKGIYRIDLGSIYIGEKFKCFLDYYQTNYSIYLPFIGLKELSATQVVGHTVIVKYIVDIMTGVCKAQLYLDSTSFLFAEYDGLMGIDCTLTSSNQKQAELVNATRFINAGMSVATANPMGIATAITGLATNGVENHYHSTQSNSAIANASVVDCFIIYDEPQVPIANGVYPNNYAKTVGLPCGRSYKIGECSGYIKCGGDVQGTFPRATSEEIDEIMNLLQNGIEV